MGRIIRLKSESNLNLAILAWLKIVFNIVIWGELWCLLAFSVSTARLDRKPNLACNYTHFIVQFWLWVTTVRCRLYNQIISVNFNIETVFYMKIRWWLMSAVKENESEVHKLPKAKPPIFTGLYQCLTKPLQRWIFDGWFYWFEWSDHPSVVTIPLNRD